MQPTMAYPTLDPEAAPGGSSLQGATFVVSYFAPTNTDLLRWVFTNASPQSLCIPVHPPTGAVTASLTLWGTRTATGDYRFEAQCREAETTWGTIQASTHTALSDAIPQPYEVFQVVALTTLKLVSDQLGELNIGRYPGHADDDNVGVFNVHAVQIDWHV